MPENKKVMRWGILGAGNISETFAAAINQIADAKLYAVAARSLEKAEQFAKRFDAEKAYGSYEALVNDPKVDLVYIGTIHTMHYEHMKLCIEHGKSVVCEKPFTVNTKQAEEIRALAKKHSVFVMEAMWTKFLPVTAKVKEWIKEGRIGEVKEIRADFGFWLEYDENSRIYSPSMAGGALLDVGIYPLAYAAYLKDQEPVQMVGTAVYAKSGVDARNSVLLTYEDGTIAVLSSAVDALIGQDARIIGTKGVIEVPFFYQAQKAVRYTLDGVQAEVYECPHLVNGYEYEAMAAMQSVRRGLTEYEAHTIEDTLKILRQMDDLRNMWDIKYPCE